MNEVLSLKRLGFLVQAEIKLRGSRVLNLWILFVIVLAITNVIAGNNLYTIQFNPAGLFFMLFFGGLYLASGVFKDIHNKQMGYQYLMLPATTLEKLISKVLIWVVGYTLLVVATYAFFYWIVGLIYYFFSGSLILFNPFNEVGFSKIIFIWSMQCIFILGSLYFHWNVIIKTLIALAAIALIYVIVVSILSSIYISTILPVSFVVVKNSFGSSYHLNNPILNTLISVLCLVIGYFRLKEQEV